MRFSNQSTECVMHSNNSIKKYLENTAPALTSAKRPSYTYLGLNPQNTTFTQPQSYLSITLIQSKSQQRSRS